MPLRGHIGGGETGLSEKGVLDDGFHLSCVVFEVRVQVPGGNVQEAVGS